MGFKINENIELAALTPDDSYDIFNVIDSQRDYLGEWLPFISLTKDVSYTEAFIQNSIDQSAINSDRTYTIRYQGNFAGLFGIKNCCYNNRRFEIGYWLSEPFQGRGIITDCVKRVISWGFREENFNRIEIKCAANNLKSSAIPIKLGFTLEGVERQGEYHPERGYFDIEVYSLLESEYHGR